MKKKTVYIETTVVSYLTARPTGNLVGAAWQAITAEWWNCRHLDNAETKPVMRRICEEWGYVVPEICTPQELMGRSG